MIRQFETIKNLGVFANYINPSALPQFERFNLIYGTNGSGKTTLSRFFSDLNTGEAASFPNLKYKINTDEGKFTQGQSYTRLIRVFNSEYVDHNIGEIEGQLNPIFIIGEDNKTLATQLKNDEKAYETILEKITAEEKENAKLLKKRSKQFTDIARTISQDTAGTSSRTYNKKNAETAFAKLETVAVLTPQELANAIAALRQAALNIINPLTVPDVKLTHNNSHIELFAALAMLTTETERIAQESSISIAISKLVENPEIASWVEKGRDIHVGTEVCQYCLQAIPASREEALKAHFNDSDSQLKSEILSIELDAQIVLEALKGLTLPHRDSFYKDKQGKVVKVKELWEAEIQSLIEFMGIVRKALNEKLSRRTESYELDLKCPSTQRVSDTIKSLNIIIDDTNNQSTAYEAHITEQEDSIEAHHLSVIHNDVTDLDMEITESDKRLDTLKNGTDSEDKIVGSLELIGRISSARTTLSDSHKGAGDLSQKLASFLGRDDLKFVAEDEGYRIERFGRPAQKLSEGEKTAITFLHFVVGLHDQDFDLSEGIVVIDDPISSLDAASIYQAFGFLKVAVKDAKQIFMMTHNFEFLKLLLNWMKNGPKKRDITYLMLKCAQDSTSRVTTICELDKVLLTASNEYQYLFKLLREFQSDGTIANSYHIPNVVRKVLETFLDQHSHGGSLYKKLSNLTYDEQKKTALNKYANDLSHPTFSGIDPSLIGETQTNVGIVLKMIEDVAPMHFEALVKNTL